MKNNLNFETYLFISQKKFTISVFAVTHEKIYQNEFVFENEKIEIDFEKLDRFLDKNIFKIEKLLQNFVNHIVVILELDNFFPVELSIKKNDYKDTIVSNNIKYLLSKAKDCIQQSLDKESIIHILINNYNIDGNDYSYLPQETKGNCFSIDLKFICLSNKLMESIEKILRKYHISLNQVVSSKYVKSFLTENENDIFILTKKILDGYNQNEVKLIAKTQKNHGFFEKFFNFFN